MALKDWVKTPTYYGDMWRHKQGFIKGMVFVNFEGYSSSKPYFVEVHKRYFGGVSEKPTIRKRFKTRIQAMRFAKNYMRLH